MRKLFFLLAVAACSLLSYGQTHQMVWNDGRMQYAVPIVKVDSLSYPNEVSESDTLFLIMPRPIKQVEHDTVTVVKNDTVTIVQHDTIYIKVGAPAGVQAVDLGLPSGVKWASCNVGAESPEEYGNYYAWGEVTTKEDCSWATYNYANGSKSELTKYCTRSTYGKDGFTDGKTTLDLEDDAAHVNWGGAWRMPTDAEWTELRNNCTWTWTTQNNVNGCLVKSNTNSNSIFLPAAGYRNGTSLSNVGSYGYYWSASLFNASPYSAWDLYFGSGSQSRSSYSRYYGFSVRAVCL